MAETTILAGLGVLDVRIMVILLAVLMAAQSVGAVTAEGEDVSAEPTALPENAALSPRWDFTLRPYFFLSGLTGSVTVEAITIPLNSQFADLLDNVELGAFLNLRAEKRRWGINADFQYINLAAKGTGPGETSLDLKNVIGEIDLLYRPAKAPTLRFLVGARLYSVKQQVRLLGRDLPAVSTTVIDPIVGSFGSWKLHDRWDFELRGDIGGFGLSSEFNYQMMALFVWGVGDTIRVPFGYRVLGFQIRNEDLWMNTRMSGLVLGLDARF